jgi:hypothetical protein
MVIYFIQNYRVIEERRYEVERKGVGKISETKRET